MAAKAVTDAKVILDELSRMTGFGGGSMSTVASASPYIPMPSPSPSPLPLPSSSPPAPPPYGLMYNSLYQPSAPDPSHITVANLPPLGSYITMSIAKSNAFLLDTLSEKQEVLDNREGSIIKRERLIDERERNLHDAERRLRAKEIELSDDMRKFEENKREFLIVNRKRTMNPNYSSPNDNNTSKRMYSHGKQLIRERDTVADVYETASSRESGRNNMPDKYGKYNNDNYRKNNYHNNNNSRNNRPPFNRHHQHNHIQHQHRDDRTPRNHDSDVKALPAPLPPSGTPITTAAVAVGIAKINDNGDDDDGYSPTSPPSYQFYNPSNESTARASSPPRPLPPLSIIPTVIITDDKSATTATNNNNSNNTVSLSTI